MGAFYVRGFLEEATVLFNNQAEELKAASREFISATLPHASPSPMADFDLPVVEDRDVPDDETQEGIKP